MNGGTPGDLQGNKYVKNVNDGVDITAHFILVCQPKVKITFTYTGSGIAPKVSYQVQGGSHSEATAPFTIEVDKGKEVSFSYENLIESGGSRYILDSVSPSSPIVANSDTTVKAYYHAEYYLKVISAYDTPTPSSGWFEAGSEIKAKVNSPIESGGTRRVCTGWTGSGSVPSSGSGKSVTFTINEPSTITWNWKSEYLITFRQMGLGSDSHGIVLTVDGAPKEVNELPYSVWASEGDSISYHYETSVSSSDPSKKYWLQHVTGPSSSIKVTKSDTVTGVYLELPSNEIKNSESYFDTNSLVKGQQFRLIYTENTSSSPTYKLTASNAGRFTYNVFYLGTPGEKVSIDIRIPYPFETVGEDPVRVYSYIEGIGPGMFKLSQELKDFKITGTDTQTASGSLGIILSDYGINPGTASTKLTINVEGIIPQTGLVIASTQMNYGLKGSIGYTQGINNNAMIGFSERITNYEAYVFSYAVGNEEGNTTIYNENVFKRNRGFAGIVTDEDDNPVKGATVYLYGPSGSLIASTLTDSDGWYEFDYHHTGGAATYTLRCNGITKMIIVFSGLKSTVNF